MRMRELGLESTSQPVEACIHDYGEPAVRNKLKVVMLARGKIPEQTTFVWNALWQVPWGPSSTTRPFQKERLVVKQYTVIPHVGGCVNVGMDGF